jgi:hypothetical protein
MRDPWISDEAALRERLSDPGQLAPDAPVPDLPPYARAFLAHLRLLVGVPFDYLVPDPLMLPNESIRFFHLDRSWTDRLVDGVLAVGKIGSREQAHHQQAAADLDAQLDELEPNVRPMQRGLASIEDRAATADADAGQPITGMLLRSALVSGWPHMDIAAYTAGVKLTLLRLERLAPAVLIALWAGIPDRVQLEEPHHGIQFGASSTGDELGVLRRRPDGHISPSSDTLGTVESAQPAQPSFPFGFRDPALRVVEIAALRKLLSYEADLRDPPRDVDDPAKMKGMPLQTGSAAFAVELLQPPWRQVYADDAQPAPSGPHPVAISVRELGEAFDAVALAASLEDGR